MENLNWRSLNESIDKLTEEDLLALLNAERGNRRRVSIMVRMHQRYCALRASRERLELLSEGAAP